KHAGNDVRIVAPSSRPERDQGCVTVIGESAFGLPATGSVANVCPSYDLGPRVKPLCAREQFDIVHVHEPFMPLLPFQFLRYSTATNIATFHAAREGGSRLYAYSKYIIRPWWGRIQGRIAVSGAALRLIGKHFASRYRIIPNGVDCAPNTGGESMGIVLLEALAAGVTIAASRIEGFSEVLTDGGEGLLVQPRDSQALAAALKRLLSDQGLRKKMGHEAQKTAKRYDWARVSAQIIDYYKECMADRSQVET